MEESHPPIDSVEEHSAKTAEMLRSMRTQADKALESHLRKIEDIETELNRRIQQIAEELAHDGAADEMEAAALNAQLEELSKSQEALRNAEAEIAAQAEQLQQLSEDRDQLSQERHSLSEELGELLTEQLKSSEELVELAEQLENLQEDLDRTSHERDQAAEKHGKLADELEQLLADAEESDGQRDRLTGELEELGTQYNSLQGERDQLAQELEQFQDQHTQLAGERDQLAEQLQQLQAEHEQITSQRDQLDSELQATQEALDEVREEQEKESTQFSEELAAAQENHSQAQQKNESLEAQLQALRQEHLQTCQSLEETRVSSDEIINRLTNELTENKHLTEELNEAVEQQKTEHGRIFDEQKEHIEQSNRKCELALADVHKLKRANAELHEELASRPEADDQDSPELVSLRAERDALAGRVEELNNAPLPKLDDDSQQELSDLQRRFEMAVEDVRSLKQENASLHEKLEASPAAPVEASGSDDMGWQAQKARLLASLNAEDEGQVTPERREERITVEGTIAITDRVVSEKDREISELKAQLQARLAETKQEPKTETTQEESQQAVHDELFSNDEVIQAERGRLEQLQNEWKDKLRTAELDISVQRATLAREQAKLEEKLAVMESQAAEIKRTGGKPKRRWLSALGLHEDDEEDG